MKRDFFLVVIILLLTGACRTPHDISYFQGIENLTEEEKAAMTRSFVPIIGIDDALIINVSSSDRASTAPFSMPPYGYFMPGEAEIGIAATTQNLYTYLVDENGDINFPVLGRVHVAGLSINEAIRMMEQLIWETAPKAVVMIQIANFKVGIIGEVKMPDIYIIKTPRITILELIAKAGDLTIMADRKNVWLHRDNDGEKVQVRMDLTDPAIFASPYYYLQQNDMVYVRPNDAQKRNSKYSNTDNMRVGLYTAIFSSISVVMALIVNIRHNF